MRSGRTHWRTSARATASDASRCSAPSSGARRSRTPRGRRHPPRNRHSQCRIDGLAGGQRRGQALQFPPAGSPKNGRSPAWGVEPTLRFEPRTCCLRISRTRGRRPPHDVLRRRHRSASICAGPRCVLRARSRRHLFRSRTLVAQEAWPCQSLPTRVAAAPPVWRRRRRGQRRGRSRWRWRPSIAGDDHRSRGSTVSGSGP